MSIMNTILMSKLQQHTMLILPCFRSRWLFMCTTCESDGAQQHPQSNLVSTVQEVHKLVEAIAVSGEHMEGLKAHTTARQDWTDRS